jgi:GNAT superfamily N-acetyltransferase
MHARPARPDDHDAFLGFWAELGLDQPAPPREVWAQNLCPNTIFLDDDGTLAAYNLCFAFGARGDVRQVVVAPAYRRRGVGRLLMAAVADKLRARGCTEWRLEVRASNAPALALYRAVGMRPLGDVFSVTMDAAACARFAQAASGRHVAQEVTPADDAALEGALDLGAGQLARWRAHRAGAPMRRIGVTGFTQIWRDYAPAHGLLFPFRAPDVDVAAHLLAAALPAPGTDAAYEVCVIEPVLHAALLAAGAVAKDHQLELGGPL